MAIGTAVQTFLNTIRNWVTQNAAQLLYVDIPQSQVETDQDKEIPYGTPLTVYRDYFRLWLCEMFLTKGRAWFTAWHPAVHSSVLLNFGGVNNVNFSHVTDPPQQDLSQGVFLNYNMTDLLPFNGGTVTISAALLALPGSKNELATSIGILKDFSSLIAAPLGQVLDVASKVTSGMQALANATQGGVHLGMHQTFVSGGGGGSNQLKPGYIAVILATANQIDPKGLYVKDNRLHTRASQSAKPQPLQGYDYMLFRVEGRKQRDNWRLPNIQEPLDKAAAAFQVQKSDDGVAFRNAALVAATESKDLSVSDRRRVSQAIRDELAPLEVAGAGAAAGPARTLDEIITARAIPVDQAYALGELSLAELLSP